MGTRGPAPDPNAIRRDRPSDQATWTELPYRREGPPPPWPEYLGEPAPDSMKARLWAELWTMPQAVMWEAQRRHIEVAQHVETLCAIQMGPPDGARSDPTPTLRGLALRQQIALTLTGSELNRMRWRISPEHAEEATKTNDRRPASSVKDRFKVVAIEDHRKAG